MGCARIMNNKKLQQQAIELTKNACLETLKSFDRRPEYVEVKTSNYMTFRAAANLYEYFRRRPKQQKHMLEQLYKLETRGTELGTALDMIWYRYNDINPNELKRSHTKLIKLA